MREILFKAKSITTGEWVEGDLVRSYLKIGNACITDFAKGIVCGVDESTICQYTGLTDKNGNKIWENDVVKGKYWERGNSHRHIGEIKYIGNAFKVVGVKQYKGYHDELNGSYEIIGNIFDNPELLGV